MTWSDFWQRSGISLRLLTDFLPLLLALITVALGYVNVLENINPKEVQYVHVTYLFKSSLIERFGWLFNFCLKHLVKFANFHLKGKILEIFLLPEFRNSRIFTELTQTPFGTVI